MHELHLSDEELDALLISGKEEQRLRDVFGDDLYEELRGLARQAEVAQTRVSRAAGQVFMLPGIMGSKLSVQEGRDSDLIWLNPISLALGRVSDLTWPDTHDVRASGVFHFAYQRMRLRLMIKGHRVKHIPFDWRRSVPEIAARLRPEIMAAQGPVSIIAHSMGGLVARALAASDPDRHVRRIVTLGTPNLGSYAPVTVLRGIHRNVHLLGRLDPNLGPKALVERILNRYEGLLEMMPSPARRDDEHWFDNGFWPDGSLLPPGDILADAGRAQAELPPPDDRFTQIVGTGKPTIVRSQRNGDALTFVETNDGDGTVPRDLAEMDGAGQRFYVEGKHGSLCNLRAVIEACHDVLSGRTPNLATSPPVTRAVSAELPEPALRSHARSGLPRSSDPTDPAFSDPALLDGFLSAKADIDPAERETLGPVAPEEIPEDNTTYVYTRQKRALRRINVDVMNADILDVPADAYVLGVFEGVTTLGGAIGAVDRELGGILSALLADGQITGRKGEVSFIPIPRHHLRTSHVVIVGLGALGRTDDVLSSVRVAGRNLMRSLCISEVSSFAGVLLGAGSGPKPTAIFKSLFTGIFEALEDWDEDQSFSCIRICEYDKNRYDVIVDSLNRTFAGFNMTECEIVVQKKQPPATRVVRRISTAAPKLPDIFTVRAELADEDSADPELTLHLHHVPGSGNTQAALQNSTKPFRLSELSKRMAPMAQALHPDDLVGVARSIEELVLSDAFREHIDFDHDSGYGLQVICDTWASRVPWEVLHLGGPPIALNGGINRWYLPASGGVSRSARRPMQQHPRGRPINMLLVADPTRDLPGARTEARQIEAALFGNSGYSLDVREGEEATLTAVSRALERSDSDELHDIFHYAGHAFFEEADRARSGLILAGEKTLRGTDIARMAQVPGFVFLNACESVRVRRRDADMEMPPRPQDFAARNTGLAEAFLLAGVRHIVGTFWPVPDDTALDFASMFYKEVQKDNASIGSALSAARRRIAERGSADWVNYIHYGAANDNI